MQFSFFSLTWRKEMKEKKTPNRQNLCVRLTWDQSSMKKRSERVGPLCRSQALPPSLRVCVCVCLMLLQWVVSVCPVTIPTSLPVFLRVKAPFLPCFLLQLFARRPALLPASRPPFLRTLVSVSEAADELTPKSHSATNIRPAPPSTTAV